MMTREPLRASGIPISKLAFVADVQPDS
jgi:hypothetical protein